MSRIGEYIEASNRVRLTVAHEQADIVEEISRRISSCIAAGGKVLACGNGGSAADCQHFTGELVGRFLRERRALPAIALTANTSEMTSIANDYSFDEVFARQVEGLGGPGDLLLAISTSGNSPNVLRAVEAARQRSMVVCGLAGAGGGKLAPLCDTCLVVPSDETPIVQECHAAVIHLICEAVEADA